ncbi:MULTISPECIES: aspartyl-phosphate phosphatase Spo0E family protein [Paenibacillus]|uniref:Aspartyl-phosphate phosphatase Spo0E family protein n=1 Tax=Paenibacillus radicis (ex Xue et al. 2023) TaxID=2972489 RepID=A0ABT1YF63_9BACL|nr:aspartyl-phosphate phosphatase Spo0E family protein [Paenibacillus radicis (ex Xue et al. 2023)]MCR8631838.1 aspartyl-phosphate phosphatase Spo0E family protein [Paenibacillus radicis (ex Xue et al. 2023)]
MIIATKLEKRIHSYVGELNELVNVQGYELSNPVVVKKSMELDLLILKAMRSRKKRFHQNEAS